MHVGRRTSVSGRNVQLCCQRVITLLCSLQRKVQIVDGRAAGHLGAADGLKTSSIHVCVCPHWNVTSHPPPIPTPSPPPLTLPHPPPPPLTRKRLTEVMRLSSRSVYQTYEAPSFNSWNLHGLAVSTFTCAHLWVGTS